MQQISMVAGGCGGANRMAYDEATVERVRRMLKTMRDVTEKPMMGGLCFIVQGSICCSVSGTGGLLVRVDRERYDAILGDKHVRRMQMGKRIMRGFVRVTPEGYRTEAMLRRWASCGVESALKASHKRCADRVSSAPMSS